MSLVQPNK